MILLSVGYSKKNRSIYDSLKELCKFFKEKNINIAMAENDLGNMHYVKCILKDAERDLMLFDQFRELFYSCSSNAIYDYISHEYISENIEKLLIDNFSYLNETDFIEIKNRCNQVISGNGMFSTESLIYSMGCKNNIIRKINDYLGESPEILLDGFITFRLKEINNELSTLVEKLVEDYVVEKEYSEFIKLLKYFVDVQECKYDLVNIIINSIGDYIIEDGYHRDISKEFFEDFNMDCIKGEVNKHDILVSALISCAPNKVIIHGLQNSKCQEVLDTIKNIFSDRVTFCTSCDICQPSQKQAPNQST